MAPADRIGMDKNGHNVTEALIAILLGLLGGAAILALIAALTKPKCPNCQQPIGRGTTTCPHCGTGIDWW